MSDHIDQNPSHFQPGEILERRYRRAAEQLMENEALLQGMDEAAARALLQWSIALSRIVIHRTTNMGDAEAEAASYPGMRSIRLLMRLLSRWIQDRASMDLTAQKELLGQVINILAPFYASTPLMENDSAREQILLTPMLTPLEMVTTLRELFEPRTDPNPNYGGENAQ